MLLRTSPSVKIKNNETNRPIGLHPAGKDLLDCYGHCRRRGVWPGRLNMPKVSRESRGAGFASLLLLVILAGLNTISTPNTKSSFTASDVFIFLGVLFLGTPAAILIGVADSFVSSRRTSKRRANWIAAPAMMAVTVFIAGNAFYLVLARYAQVSQQPLGATQIRAGSLARRVGVAGDTPVLHQRFHNFNDLCAEEATADSEVLARRLSVDLVVVSGIGNRDGGHLLGRVAAGMDLRTAERADHRRYFLDLQDLDDFKLVNDTFGHKVGDRMLREVAGLVHAQLREYDFLARYAGDEFVAIVPDTAAEQVEELRERIERVVPGFSIDVRAQGCARVGISVGSAVFGVDGETLDHLLVAADQAMYRAKSTHKTSLFRAANLETSVPKAAAERPGEGPLVTIAIN